MPRPGPTPLPPPADKSAIAELILKSADGSRELKVPTFYDKSLVGELPSVSRLPVAIADAMSATREADDMAHAVISAKDGAWQVVPIGMDVEGEDSPVGVVIDGRNLPDWVAGVQVNDAAAGVAAIIGRDTVHNLSGRKLDRVGPNQPEAWTGVPLATVKTRPNSPFEGKTFQVTGFGSAVSAGSDLPMALERAALSVRDGVTTSVAVLEDDEGQHWLSRLETEGDDSFLRSRDIEVATPGHGNLRAIVGTQDMFVFGGKGTQVLPVAGAAADKEGN